MTSRDTAVERLARNRAQARQWLASDHQRREAFDQTRIGQFTQLPWLRGLSSHPLTSMALGAFARWWMRPRRRPVSASPAVRVVAAGAAFRLLTRHPLLTLFGGAAVVAAMVWKSRTRAPGRLPPPGS